MFHYFIVWQKNKRFIEKYSLLNDFGTFLACVYI